MKQLFLMIVIGVAAFAQAPKVDAKVPEPSKMTPAPPSLNTSKYWRLVVQAQAARTQANETPQAKAADAAQALVATEVSELAKVCGEGMVLTLDQDKNSKTADDVICIVKPAEPKPSEKK